MSGSNNKRLVARNMVTDIRTGEILSNLPVFSSDMNNILRSWHILIYTIASLDVHYPSEGLYLIDLVDDYIEAEEASKYRSRRTKTIISSLEMLDHFLIKYNPLVFRHANRTWIRLERPVIQTYDLGTSFLLPIRVYLRELDFLKGNVALAKKRDSIPHFLFNSKILN